MITPQRYAREIPQRYRLEASKCINCGQIHFPPRLVCGNCSSQKSEIIRLSNEGKIVTWTVIHTTAPQFKKCTPYALAIVELDGGGRLTAQVADCDFKELDIGKKVRIVFRKIQEEDKSNILCYGYKCVLV